jgi:quercetin dioxygenase-like cupin family protein
MVLNASRVVVRPEQPSPMVLASSLNYPRSLSHAGAQMTTDDRLRTHPHERLSAALQHIDLIGAAAQLRAEPHLATHGHRQAAIVRHGPLSMILFAFESGGLLKEHRTDGEVVIQVLTGEIEVVVGAVATVMRRGELLAVAAAEPHSVRAIEASDMLLTVCRRAATSTAA